MNALVKYLLPVIALGMLGFGCFHVVRSQPVEKKATPPATPAQSPFPRTLAAAGLVEACSENLAIGTAISGVVLEVYVPSSQVGTYVTKGTPLFRVDDRHLQAQLKVQQANLAAAEANLSRLDAMPRVEEMPSLEAKLRGAEANYRLLKDMADRSRLLLDRKAISFEESTQREINAEVGLHQWEQAKADLGLMKAGAWQPDKQVSRAAIALAKAQIEQTKTEIERATVRAPIDGHVLQVNVRPGEHVGLQPGQTLVMMGDLSRYHVRVDLDEHDIPRFQPSGAARAFVRGYSQDELKLSFVRIERYVTPKRSLTGDNTERVDTRVLQVIYAIEPSSHPVYVGQQLDVYIEEPSGR